MKTPNIEIYKSENGYYVLFGIGERIEFRNKTIAKEYVYDIKKLIKDCLHIVSLLQSNLYTSYRSIYFNMDHRLNRKLKSSIHQFDDRIDFVFKNYQEGNSAFIFTEINNLFSTLEYTILLLKEYAREYKQFALKNLMYGLLKHLENVQDSFERDKNKIKIDFRVRNRKMKVVKHLKSS